MSPETKEALALLEKNGLYGKESSPFDHVFPKNTTLFEKMLFLIMHLTAGLWFIPIIALCASKPYAWQLLIGDIVLFFAAYFFFKVIHGRRTGESSSLGFNPKFHWAGEQYDRKRVSEIVKGTVDKLRKA